MTYYSYFKKFSPSSIGGVSKPVSRATAKTLITKMKGKVDPKWWRNNIGERTILFENGNRIFMYAV